MKPITLGNRELDLHWTTGDVASTSKNLETKVRGGGGGGSNGYTAPVTISSTTTVHDQLFLIDARGQESSFQLQGFDLACRESNRVTVLHAIPRGKQTGPYVLVYNHSTNKPAYHDGALKRLLYPSRRVYLAATVGAAMSMFYVSFLGLVAIVALAVHFNKTTNARVREFKSSLDPRELLS